MIMIDWKKSNNKKQLDIGILQLKDIGILQLKDIGILQLKDIDILQLKDIGILQLKIDVCCIFFLLVVNWLLDKKIKYVD